MFGQQNQQNKPVGIFGATSQLGQNTGGFSFGATAGSTAASSSTSSSGGFAFAAPSQQSGEICGDSSGMVLLFCNIRQNFVLISLVVELVKSTGINIRILYIK